VKSLCTISMSKKSREMEPRYKLHVNVFVNGVAHHGIKYSLVCSVCSSLFTFPYVYTWGDCVHAFWSTNENFMTKERLLKRSYISFQSVTRVLSVTLLYEATRLWRTSIAFSYWQFNENWFKATLSSVRMFM